MPSPPAMAATPAGGSPRCDSQQSVARRRNDRGPELAGQRQTACVAYQVSTRQGHERRKLLQHFHMLREIGTDRSTDVKHLQQGHLPNHRNAIVMKDGVYG